MSEKKSIIQSQKPTIQASFLSCEDNNSVESFKSLRGDEFAIEQSQSPLSSPKRKQSKNLDKLDKDTNKLKQSVETHDKTIHEHLNWKKKIYFNNIILSGILNLTLSIVIVYCTVTVDWYTLNSRTKNQTIVLGLIFQVTDNGYSLIKEPAAMIAGYTTFLILWFGIVQQFWFTYLQIKYIIRCQDEKVVDGQKNVRFKTLSKTIFYTYIFGLGYWTGLTMLANVRINVLQGFERQHPSTNFFLALSAALLFMPIYIYFKLVKEKLRQNIVMSQLIRDDQFMFK